MSACGARSGYLAGLRARPFAAERSCGSGLLNAEQDPGCPSNHDDPVCTRAWSVLDSARSLGSNRMQILACVRELGCWVYAL